LPQSAVSASLRRFRNSDMPKAVQDFKAKHIFFMLDEHLNMIFLSPKSIIYGFFAFKALLAFKSQPGR
jgi:hypothetical protein